MIKKQLYRFGLVGLSAFSVHFLSVMFFVKMWNIPPLGANVLGFLLGVQVSYWGHYKWTFEAHHISHKRASLRFFFIALSSFGINELMYAGLLTTQLPYDLSLFMILVFISLSTFILSKFWAFR